MRRVQQLVERVVKPAKQNLRIAFIVENVMMDEKEMAPEAWLEGNDLKADDVTGGPLMIQIVVSEVKLSGVNIKVMYLGSGSGVSG